MEKMRVFDIEADGLEATKLHCLSANYAGKIKSTDSYNNMRAFLDNTDVLIGHNIARYDIPTLERLLDYDLKGKRFVDTLAISWYIQPQRKIHGLESYGEEYNMPKVVVDDWEGLTVEEYMARCNRDVEINTRLWEEQYAHLLKIYGDDASVWKLINYLSFKMSCAAEQERSRWRLDVDRCLDGLAQLEADKAFKVDELAKAMPLVPVVSKKTRPKEPFKMNGEPSVIGQRWFDLLKENNLPREYRGTVEVVSSFAEPKPTSPQQIKAWLFSLGWKPDEFRYEKEKDGKLRKIPQVNKQTPGEVGVTESIKNLFDKEPRLELLDGLSILTHRISILNGFMKNVDSGGYIKAEMQGFTNTLRYRHTVIVNLPGVHVQYGDLIRGCLIAPEGYELCGSDMSSLEDRVKQHFIWAYDPEYVKKMMEPGYDPHTTLAVFAKAITSEEESDFKIKVDPSYSKVKVIRKVYKQTNYACQYGAGGPKVALSAGISVDQGNKLVEAYWKLNWAIREVADHTTVKTVKGQMWLYNPISGLYYSLRHKKDIFSTLCQGSGVYCFDMWIRMFRRNRPQLTATFHDEVVLCVKIGEREEITKLLRDAIDETNRQLGLNITLDVDIQFGKNYSEIH